MKISIVSFESQKNAENPVSIMNMVLIPVGIAAVDVGNVADDEVHTLDDGIMTVGADGDDNCDDGFTQTDLLCESTLA